MIHFRENKHIVAKFAFLFFLFFAVFGTSMPFREKVIDPSEIGGANFVNQMVYSLIFLLSLYVLSVRWKEIFAIIKKEKFLFIFLLWCLLSVSWSGFGFVSFKRIFQVITVVAVSLAFLLNTNSTRERLFYFKLILSLYVVISLVAVILVPEASHSTGTWRGIASHKNQLGQVALVSLLFWFHSLWSASPWQKAQTFVLIVVSLLLLVGSRSVTSLMTVLLLVSIGSICFVNTKLKNRLSIGNTFFFLMLFFLFVAFSGTLFLAPELFAVLPEHLGKDNSLTGRTDIWADVFGLARQHLVLGSGFGGFWVIENPDLMVLYKKYVFLPQTAHNGYLDLLNETGVVGISVIILMLIAYFKNLKKFLQLKESQIWIWVVMSVLILNVTETTLFATRQLTGSMFIFSYLALYVDLIRGNIEYQPKFIQGERPI